MLKGDCCPGWCYDGQKSFFADAKQATPMLISEENPMKLISRKDQLTVSIISAVLAVFMLFFPKPRPTSCRAIRSLRLPLNQAKPHQLQCLPGIGWQRATTIYIYRCRYGPFTDYSQLRQIPGIGQWLIEKIKARTVLDLLDKTGRGHYAVDRKLK